MPTEEPLLPEPADDPPVPTVDAEPALPPAAEPPVPTVEELLPPPADEPPVPIVEAEPPPLVPAEEPPVPTVEELVPPPAVEPPVPTVELVCASAMAAEPAIMVVVRAAIANERIDICVSPVGWNEQPIPGADEVFLKTSRKIMLLRNNCAGNCVSFAIAPNTASWRSRFMERSQYRASFTLT